MTTLNALCAFFNTSGKIAAGVFNSSSVSGTSFADALKQLPNTTALKACTLLQNCSNFLSLTCNDEQVGCSGLTSEQTNQFENTLCQGFNNATLHDAAMIAGSFFAILFIVSVCAMCHRRERYTYTSLDQRS